MITAATRTGEYAASGEIVYLALELGEKTWKLGFTTGLGQKPRLRTVRARDRGALESEIGLAKKRFGLGDSARVVSCYESGREGFWLHRYLVAQGIENRVVDPSSIEVNRRARRVKTDRLDVGSLLRKLVRYWSGEKGVWSVVRVPTVEAEDRRQLNRELQALKRDRARVTNRIKGLLATQGIRMAVKGDVPAALRRVRLWDGSLLPVGLRSRLGREWAKTELLSGQIDELERERRRLLREGKDDASEQARRLWHLKAIGEASAWVFATEFFSWRAFRNGREVGSLSGLVPSPYQSGESSREGGMSKAGNRYVRAMAVEVAWCWLRYQPQSALSHWYEERFGSGSSRIRKIGIVALARRLLIELWRYLETGALPEGAVLRA
ncbi:MAG: IS110 family transposase [Gemmatimonadales bacterium]|jgi:transposase